ncbi:MAG: outer membrane protein assembly factor BamD [Deltaproteobacteria bacterium]|nr:outer membrane protein assembly factor BamD [Deltaproteobacteria bacterium]MBW2143572.1 outer membrane protein assembly factor BamD [Deltaproteobacteria bacterium]
MRKFHNIVKWALVCSLMVVFLGGCASDKALKKKPKKKENPPAELMEEGRSAYEDEYYLSAIESFQKIVDRYPYSKFYAEAELKIADSYYYSMDYDAAFDAYTEFQRLHPKNPKIPYVLYQKGQCHFSQVSTVDRDHSHTLHALEQFERLVKDFPKSEYSDQTHWKIRECYMKLAGSELYVGHFYFKMKKYKAAMTRYRYILENFPDLGQYHEALEYLTKSEEKLAEEMNGEKKSRGGIFSIFN